VIHSARFDHSPLLEFSLHCTAEWRSPQHNVLLEGPEASTDAVLRLLAPHLQGPVIWKARGATFEIPAGDVGALILQDVDGLSTQEQSRLLTWIDASPDVQIVSTTAYRLFALVARGRFDAALYYRLNVILLNVDRRHDFGFHAEFELRDTDVPVPYA
jgi:sigma54-dependent transcription regulator